MPWNDFSEATTAVSPAAMAAAGGARSRRLGAWWPWLLGLLLVAGAAGVGYFGWQRAARAELTLAASHRLDMLASALDGNLVRSDFLPALLETASAVDDLLETPADDHRRSAVNIYLERVNAIIGAELVYVLDAHGVGIASSNWNDPASVVGKDWSFRPYVIDALGSGRGRFYGVGVTTGRPGYYLSYALRRAGQVRGIAVVKLDLTRDEAAWRQLPGAVALADASGVIILATREDMRYRTLAPLGEQRLAEIRSTRPYGAAPLTPLDWREIDPLNDDARIVAVDGARVLASSRTLRQAPWRLLVLDDLRPAEGTSRLAALASGLVMAVLLLLAMVGWQRRRAIHHKLANQAALQAAHDQLESAVIARTAELRAVQDELVHASKMAALGRMSAGLAHELNQPLTALRTLSDNATLLLKKGRAEEVNDNLLRIEQMVVRLTRLTAQLKVFAHKDVVERSAVRVADAFNEALALYDAALEQAAVQVRVDVQPTDMLVLADEVALGSVLANLVSNAIDAMQPLLVRRLDLQARVSGSRAELSVCDSGPGIDTALLPRLFEPFVTTKPAGAGLGLGLAIAAQLVGGLGGRIRAENRGGAGACLTVELPLAAPQPAARN